MKILPNGRQLKFKLKGQKHVFYYFKMILKEKFNMKKTTNNKKGERSW